MRFICSSYYLNQLSLSLIIIFKSKISTQESKNWKYPLPRSNPVKEESEISDENQLEFQVPEEDVEKRLIR
ncbi:hypothetical protein F8M41_016428 [Gigaspora margarita]|uniref:Uncharacterized protein n=1 Tax=Gigaspora margarita TaxID=4874 RepID=A0A8H4EMM6_GIGMA|nr:hypothetical protein F8M41_016428 [Gigaspora margarita]